MAYTTVKNFEHNFLVAIPNGNTLIEDKNDLPIYQFIFVSDEDLSEDLEFDEAFDHPLTESSIQVLLDPEEEFDIPAHENQTDDAQEEVNEIFRDLELKLKRLEELEKRSKIWDRLEEKIKSL